MVVYSHNVLGEVLENRITDYLLSYFRKEACVFLPSCDIIPIAQNKIRNCRRKCDFHYVTGFRCSCNSIQYKDSIRIFGEFFIYLAFCVKKFIVLLSDFTLSIWFVTFEMKSGDNVCKLSIMYQFTCLSQE